MYNWSEDYEKLAPPKAVLRQCHKVILTDNEAGGMGEPFWKIKKWAQAQCKSFIWMEVCDVSDVSLQWDELGTYYFGNEKDALMFTMKYKGGK